MGTFSTLSEVEAFLSDHNISAGKFTNLRVGDWFTLVVGQKRIGVTIAGFDTEHYKGDENNVSPTAHHITCIAYLGESKMNNNNSTDAAYEGATVMQDFLSARETELATILGNHLLVRRCNTSITAQDGRVNNIGWNTHKLTLMTETQIFGGVQFGTALETGEGYEKLPIFTNRNPINIYGRKRIWTRAVANENSFTIATATGMAYFAGSSYEYSVVALFCLG